MICFYDVLVQLIHGAASSTGSIFAFVSFLLGVLVQSAKTSS
jgi:hypothetical protein